MARDFNGSTDQVSIANNAAIQVASGDFTIACWIYPDAFTSFNAVFDKNGQFARELALFINSASDGFYGVGDAGGQSLTFSPTWTTGAWQHLAWRRSGLVNTFYRNGTQCATDTPVSQTGVFTNPLVIGTNPSGGGSAWDGKQAEYGLWSTALGVDEIAALAAGYAPFLIRPASLAGYWPLIGRYSPEIDLRNGNNGTLTGTTNFDHPRMFYGVPGQLRRMAGSTLRRFVLHG